MAADSAIYFIFTLLLKVWTFEIAFVCTFLGVETLHRKLTLAPSPLPRARMIHRGSLVSILQRKQQPYYTVRP